MRSARKYCVMKSISVSSTSKRKVYMKKRLTSSPDFTIRPLETSAEIETFFRLNAEIFRPDEDHNIVTAQRRRYIAEEPGFQPRQLRAAFLGTRYIGGYALLERTMCLGPARLSTGR